MPHKRARRKAANRSADQQYNHSSESGSSYEEQSLANKYKFVTQNDLQKIIKKLQQQQQNQKQQKEGKHHVDKSSNDSDVYSGSESDSASEISFRGGYLWRKNGFHCSWDCVILGKYVHIVLFGIVILVTIYIYMNTRQ